MRYLLQALLRPGKRSGGIGKRTSHVNADWDLNDVELSGSEGQSVRRPAGLERDLGGSPDAVHLMNALLGCSRRVGS